MPLYTDQLHRTVQIPAFPRRIVSLVPSQTELLYHLGLDEQVVGITKFCVHPRHWFRQKQRIGGTKNLHLEKVFSLRPDLVIANMEENEKQQVEELAKHFPVWISDVNTLDSALEMIESIGSLTGMQDTGRAIATNIRDGFRRLQLPAGRVPTAYLIWKDPYMTVGGDTFINDMLERAGFQNVFRDRLRYPQICVADLQHSGCRLVLLASEPFPFGQKHIEELQPYLPHTTLALVDGEAFSWYGSWLLQAPLYFRSLHRQISSLA